MAVKFRDYYESLGIPRTSTQEEIQRAYRNAARKLHPDVNKKPDAADTFKEVQEAYEVLKDPEKRRKYDQLGANWKSGQDFSPPSGWESFRTRSAGPRPGAGDGGFSVEDAAGFSDFFESIFGGSGAGGFAEEFGRARSGPRAHRGAAARPRAGRDIEAEMEITLEDAYRGGSRSLRLRADDGEERTLTIKVPPGTTDGAVIRLAGQGQPGLRGGPAGDLLLRTRVAPHPRFRLSGLDLETTLDIAPWEAALGAKVDAPTIDGPVTLTIPPGSQSGQKLRLRGKGLPDRQGGRGDEHVVLRIVVPRTLTDAERALWERLANESGLRPRG